MMLKFRKHHFSLLLIFSLACSQLSAEPRPIPADVEKGRGQNWAALLKQSGIFLGIQHGFRLINEPGTREELKGPFVQDWIRSAGSVQGWGDKDPLLVNYVGHPMMGSVTGWLWAQNHPSERRLEFSTSRAYWMSRLKGMAWSAAYSTQFELGPVSEASIGNLGYRVPGTMGGVDLVVTPIAGMGVQVGEDLLDRYLISTLEQHIPWRIGKVLVRGFLNPTRSFANTLRWKSPWYRDARAPIYP